MCLLFTVLAQWNALITIKEILFGYRTKVQESSKYSPFLVFFRFNARQPIELTLPIPPLAENVEENVGSIRSKAQQNIGKAQQRQKKRYDLKHRGCLFKVGEKVWKYNARRVMRKQIFRTVYHHRGFGKRTAEKCHAKFLRNCYVEHLLEPLIRHLTTHMPEQLDRQVPVSRRQNGAKRHCWSFAPVDYKWEQQQSSLFGINIAFKHMPRQNNVPMFQNTKPVNCVCVRGDGNCFYRVVSIAIAGTEAHHKEIRDQIVAYLYTDRITLLLSDLFQELNVQAVGQLGNWATDAEIFATAAFLSTDFYVFTKFGWQIYEAAHLGTCKAESLCNVYIKHCNDHYYCKEIVTSYMCN